MKFHWVNHSFIHRGIQVGRRETLCSANVVNSNEKHTSVVNVALMAIILFMLKQLETFRQHQFSCYHQQCMLTVQNCLRACLALTSYRSRCIWVLQLATMPTLLFF